MIGARDRSAVHVAMEHIVRDEQRRKHARAYKMDWSLGHFGDLLWMRLPEARGMLLEQAEQEFERAIDGDDELMLPSPVGMASEVLWSGILKPALDAYPRTRSAVERYCAFLRNALDVDGVAGEEIRVALEDSSLDRIMGSKYRPIIHEIDPKLDRRLGAMFGD